MSGTDFADPDDFVDHLAELFASQGARAYLGEAVTVAEHMLQGATLAEARGLPAAVVIGALLHDVGHLSGEDGAFSMTDAHDRRHQHAGANLLQGHLPDEVVSCVREHVLAKRYLCATEDDYLRGLSDASIHSLELQGGLMPAKQAEAFAQHPHLSSILAVRRLDDEGKQPEMVTQAFAHFEPRLRAMARVHAAAAASER